jgi:hypothetical protein
MFVSSTLRYADAEYTNPHEWSASLNGVPVNALSANDERGFVDVVVTLDTFEPVGSCTCRGEDQCESCCTNQWLYEAWLKDGNRPNVVHRLFGDVRIELSSAQQQKLFATADTYTSHPVGMAADQWLRRINGDS